MDKEEALVESHSAEAAQTAAIHQEAVEKSRNAQIRAAVEETRNEFVSALHDVLNAEDDDAIFLRLKRVPFLCNKVEQMGQDIADMKGMITKVVYAALVLLASILMGLGSWAFTVLVHASHL